MGIIRKTFSICTLGLVKYRSVREQNAHTAALAQRETARQGRRSLSLQEREAALREAAFREGLR